MLPNRCTVTLETPLLLAFALIGQFCNENVNVVPVPRGLPNVNT